MDQGLSFEWSDSIPIPRIMQQWGYMYHVIHTHYMTHLDDMKRYLAQQLVHHLKQHDADGYQQHVNNQFRITHVYRHPTEHTLSDFTIQVSNYDDTPCNFLIHTVGSFKTVILRRCSSVSWGEWITFEYGVCNFTLDSPTSRLYQLAQWLHITLYYYTFDVHYIVDEPRQTCTMLPSLLELDSVCRDALSQIMVHRNDWSTFSIQKHAFAEMYHALREEWLHNQGQLFVLAFYERFPETYETFCTLMQRVCCVDDTVPLKITQVYQSLCGVHGRFIHASYDDNYTVALQWWPNQRCQLTVYRCHAGYASQYSYCRGDNTPTHTMQLCYMVCHLTGMEDLFLPCSEQAPYVGP